MKEQHRVRTVSCSLPQYRSRQIVTGNWSLVPLKWQPSKLAFHNLFDFSLSTFLFFCAGLKARTLDWFRNTEAFSRCLKNHTWSMLLVTRYRAVCYLHGVAVILDTLEPRPVLLVRFLDPWQIILQHVANFLTPCLCNFFLLKKGILAIYRCIWVMMRCDAKECSERNSSNINTKK